MFKVNTDLAKKAVEYIEYDAVHNSNSHYTFDAFLREHGLYSGKEKFLGSGDVFIHCPFHSENTPSLAVNEDKRIWHCLGCGKGGKFIDFLKEYVNEVEGRSCTWYQAVNELVASDPKLQSELHASSIFYSGREKTAEFQRVNHKKFRYSKKLPSTYLELATEMQKRKCTADQIKLAVLLMQSGFAADIVYGQVFRVESADVECAGGKPGSSDYDIGQMMEDRDGV